MIGKPGNSLRPIASGPPSTYYGAGGSPDGELSDRAIPLGYYLGIVRQHAGKIAAFVAVSVLGAYLVSKHMQPVYESTALVEVGWLSPIRVVGSDVGRPESANEQEAYMATQTRFVRSNVVLRPVVERFKLPTSDGPEQGGGQVKTSIELKNLKVNRQPNTFLIEISYRSTDAQRAAEIANAIADSYIDRTNEQRIKSAISQSNFMERQLDEMKLKMDRSQRALAQFQNELKVIDPQQKTSIVSARLVQLNTEFTNAQVERVRKESLYNSIQGGSLEAAESSGQGQEITRLKQSLDDALARFAELKTMYGSSHPEYQKAASQIAELQRQLTETRKQIGERVLVDYKAALHREDMLRQAVGSIKAEFDQLNTKSSDYQRLQQEAEADKKLYDELVGKVKEAGINAGFQDGNLRIADPALPSRKPVSPKLPLNLLAAFVFSSLCGAVLAVAAEATSTTFKKADEIGAAFGTQLIGVLPLSKQSPEVLPPAGRGHVLNGEAKPVIGLLNREEASFDRMSSFQEAIRTLRNAILLDGAPGRVKSVLITSAGPGEGKTTTSVHLAVASSDLKKRTLLIDADLRRPTVQRFFDLPVEPGLSDVLEGRLTWQQARRRVPQRPHLDVILAGAPSPWAADLIGPTIGDLLEEFKQEYDFIVFDNPPFLGFAEPLQMASVVDGLILVTSARKTSRRAVELVLSSLGRFRSKVLGIVLNRAKEDERDYGYRAYYHRNAGSINAS
jgi:capsular exopolysaccharide synthesis family protein